MSYKGMVLGNYFKIMDGMPAASRMHDGLINGNFPASGSYIDVSDCQRAHILVHLSDLDSTVTFTPSMATAANATPVAITGALHTIAADDDGEFVQYTIEVSELAANYHFLTTVVGSAAGGNDYADIVYFLDVNEKPASSDYLPSASIIEIDGSS
jgi:hypothetical protein